MDTWYYITVKSQSYCTSTLIASILDSNTRNHLSLASFAWSFLILRYLESIEAYLNVSLLPVKRPCQLDREESILGTIHILKSISNDGCCTNITTFIITIIRLSMNYNA